MKIAVLSGKGGTGKTFVSANLASIIEHSTYVDCDVEAPNGKLFFKPEIKQKRCVTVGIPAFDEDKCKGCKKCVEFCAFHALAFVKERPILFPEVCHSCGGCIELCAYNAVTELEKPVGEVFIGQSGHVRILSGLMNVGQVSGVPIIKELLKQVDTKSHTVIDCPPGSGCMVIECIKDADYCILVAEATEFGTHNLKMVYELTKVFNKPLGVVLNKCLEGRNPSEEFCRSEGIDILINIPFDHEIGKKNADGELAVKVNEKAYEIFEELWRVMREKVKS